MAAWTVLGQKSIADEIRKEFGQTLEEVRFILFHIVDWRSSVLCHYLQEQSEAYSEPCQTSKMERFAKIVNGYKQNYKQNY